MYQHNRLQNSFDYQLWLYLLLNFHCKASFLKPNFSKSEAKFEPTDLNQTVWNQVKLSLFSSLLTNVKTDSINLKKPFIVLLCLLFALKKWLLSCVKACHIKPYYCVTRSLLVPKWTVESFYPDLMTVTNCTRSFVWVSAQFTFKATGWRKEEKKISWFLFNLSSDFPTVSDVSFNFTT